jgi:hypothetical protein
MSKQNTLITKIAPLLQSEVDPSGFGAAPPTGVAAGWRKRGREVLLILVNTRKQAMAESAIALGGLEGVSSGVSVTDGAVMSLSNGKMRAALEPLGVRVLKFQLP